jgi:hypothetical protein
MVDPGTGLAVASSAPLMLKILGPTSDYLGNGLQGWTARRVENVQRIFDSAARKLGPDRLEKPGSVHPRVLGGVLEHGSYFQDGLGAEYFGGILASSKSERPHDDRGATLASLVGRLSTYQLRCHYLVYAHARRLLVGEDLNLGIYDERQEYGQVFIPWAAWEEGMGLDDEEQDRALEIAEHGIAGLSRESLIEDPNAFGSEELLGEMSDEQVFPEPGGLVFTLSILGIELFAYAHAATGVPKYAFLDPDVDFEVDVPVNLTGGPIQVRDLPVAESVREHLA